MWKSSVVPQSSQTTEGPKERYFKVEMKAWTNFDPMEKTLAEIAQAMDQGNGFLSLIEVLEIADNLASISDEDIRDGFESVVAAKRLVRSVNNLPPKVKEELRSALEAEAEMRSPHVISKKKSAGSAVEEFSRENRAQDSSLR
jgi:hypothetical protein